jgi:hypothetical protein
METKSFTIPVLVSLVSGKLLTNTFGDVHECAEFVIGHPVWTHEFASETLWQAMRAKVLEQHPDLDVDVEHVTKDNWRDVVAKLVADLGESRELRQGTDERTKTPIETLQEIRPDAQIIVAQT